TLVGSDYAAPFQYPFQIRQDVGTELKFRAKATDYEGNWSDLGGNLSFIVTENKAPQVSLVDPINGNSAVIEGQTLRVVAEVNDDLGSDGVQRVDFFVNDILVDSIYQNMTQAEGYNAAENKYAAYIILPEGISGAVLQAVAYDRLGLEGKSQPLFIKQIDDTVKPKPYILAPVSGDIVTLTAGHEEESLRLLVAVEDIGNPADRHVFMNLAREEQLETGEWRTLASQLVELINDDSRLKDTEAHSEPENYYYVYSYDFASGQVLSHDDGSVQRLRMDAWVETPADSSPHVVTAYGEIGMAFSRQLFIQPGRSDSTRSVAADVFYAAVDQYSAGEENGSLLVSWSTVSPYVTESGLGNSRDNEKSSWTGLYNIGQSDQSETSAGVTYAYSDNRNGAAEVFAGTIAEIKATSAAVFAGKSAVSASYAGTQSTTDNEFVKALKEQIDTSNSAGRFDSYEASELLIFNHQNGDNQFGLPYLLKGRADLPFAEVYGLDLSGDLALVANGDGGVIAFNVSDLATPYRTGYVKPDGFARDVLILGHYAYIAASEQGVVVVDITHPDLPVVDVFDTLGVANRLAAEGNLLYVANMAGSGTQAQLNVIDISDPHN